MVNDLPLVGAALSILDLKSHLPWLREMNRDLELQDFCFASVLSGDWRPFADAANRLLDGYQGRIGIHGPFSGFAIDTADPDMRDIVIRRIDQALDVCAALGAVQIVLHSPYTSWDNNNIDLKPNGRARKISAVHDCLASAVNRAENQGVVIVIENIQDINPLDRLTLAESFQSAAVKVSVDTGHAQFTHAQYGAPSVGRFITVAGSMLGHVHLQDADGFADRHWAIGEGTIEWHGVFQALSGIPAKPHLVLELNDSAKIPASMAHLAGLGLAR